MPDPQAADPGKTCQFKCEQCGHCCLQSGWVYLEDGEPEAMAALLGMDVYEFVNEFCELVDRRKLVLKKHPDEACIFFGEKGCRVHSAKPRQCRDFPVGWRTPNSFHYCEGLKKLYNNP